MAWLESETGVIPKLMSCTTPLAPLFPCGVPPSLWILEVSCEPQWEGTKLPIGGVPGEIFAWMVCRHLPLVLAASSPPSGEHRRLISRRATQLADRSPVHTVQSLIYSLHHWIISVALTTIQTGTRGTLHMLFIEAKIRIHGCRKTEYGEIAVPIY